jgi:competence ComEA-like helix-hairpin-helix protein
MMGAGRSPSSLGAICVLVLALTVFMLWTALERPLLLDDPDAIAAAGERRASAWPDMRVDINTATAAELNVLPGLGPMLAERIVADRDQHGPFKDVDDLDRVSGIGPAIIDRLEPYVVAESTPAFSAIPGR